MGGVSWFERRLEGRVGDAPWGIETVTLEAAAAAHNE